MAAVSKNKNTDNFLGSRSASRLSGSLCRGGSIFLAGPPRSPLGATTVTPTKTPLENINSDYLSSFAFILSCSTSPLFAHVLLETLNMLNLVISRCCIAVLFPTCSEI